MSEGDKNANKVQLKLTGFLKKERETVVDTGWTSKQF